MDHRPRVHHALVGKYSGIADQGAVAQVTILELGAVTVVETVTVHCQPRADSLGTLIGQGAGVAVGAGRGVERILAPPGLGAHVVGADVFVITHDRIADAGPGYAVVSHGAGVAILAGAGVEVVVAAALFAQALVIGAVVNVVAQVDVVPIHEVGLVRFAVTIVIKAVALFRGGSGRGAVAQSILGAGAFAFASPPLVVQGAGSGEGQFDRPVDARADSCVSHAL